MPVAWDTGPGETARPLGGSKAHPSMLALARRLASCALPTAVILLLLLHRGHPSWLCFAVVPCQALVALGALELQSWGQRIRWRLQQKLYLDAPGTNSIWNSDYRRYESSGNTDDADDSDVQNEEGISSCAIDRVVGHQSGYRRLIGALVVASVASAAIAPLVGLLTRRHVGLFIKSDFYWALLLLCVAVGSWAAFFCACMASSVANGFVLVLYQSCFLASLLSSIVGQNNADVGQDLDVLDPFYTVLMASCLIISWRIVMTNDDVMDTLVAILVDIFGLIYFVLPLLLMCVILAHPHAYQFKDEIGSFFIAITGAQVGRCVQKRMLRACLPVTLNASGHAKPCVRGHGIVVPCLFTLIALGISWVFFEDDGQMNVALFFVVIAATILGEICRLVLPVLREAADIDPLQDTTTWSFRSNGVMDMASPYLMALTVFHWYLMPQLIESLGD